MAFSIKFLDLIFWVISRLFKLLKGPFLFCHNLFTRLVVLPIFGRYLWVKTKFAKKTENAKEKVILVFTNRYVIHLIIFLIAMLVATANLLAYENREDYGQKALIYKIIGVEDMAVIEDSQAPAEEPLVYHYLGTSSGLASENFTETQGTDEAYYDEENRSELATTQGGATLIKPELASTEAAKITRTSVKEYVVEAGDVVSDIAAKFNVSLNTILWANNLSLTSYIRAGQKLVIPPTSGVLHKIAKGDTLAKIAKKYGAEPEKIKEFNRLADDAALVVGETLMVPGGKIIYAPASRGYTAPTRYAEVGELPLASSGKMYWPNGCRRISQYYRGWRHTGVDIACPWGTAIRAAESGVVSRVQYARYGYGYNIIISHGGGKQTLYGHLSQINVEVGQQVAKGQVVAKEGSTGRSTGPHLHFEIIVGGSKVNPLNYIR